LNNLCYTNIDQKQTNDTILSAAASFVLSDILSDLTRPDLPNNFDKSIYLPKVAWKTGTSYGRRDAWSIGYNKNYTVAVWLGNFNNTGVSSLSGAEIATPLMFQLFNVLDYNSTESWYATPASIDTRLVCKETGLRVNEFCNQSTIDYYLPSVSDFNFCNHKKEVFYAIDSTVSYCYNCKPDKGFKVGMFPNLSAEIIDYYTLNQIEYKKIPPHNPACNVICNSRSPQIISLQNNFEYLLSIEDNEQIKLKSYLSNNAFQCNWFVNNVYYKQCNKDEELFYLPTKSGQYKISCTDENGASSSIFITIKRY
jgi:penicillin-binding protein 1C